MERTGLVIKRRLIAPRSKCVNAIVIFRLNRMRSILTILYILSYSYRGTILITIAIDRKIIKQLGRRS